MARTLSMGKSGRPRECVSSDIIVVANESILIKLSETQHIIYSSNRASKEYYQSLLPDTYAITGGLPKLYDIHSEPIQNPLEKLLYFSNGSKYLSQTFRIFAQHILQISTKQLTCFNRHNSSNFSVQFLQMNMQLHTEYSWITNQSVHSFSRTVQMFQW